MILRLGYNSDYVRRKFCGHLMRLIETGSINYHNRARVAHAIGHAIHFCLSLRIEEEIKAAILKKMSRNLIYTDTKSPCRWHDERA